MSIQISYARGRSSWSVQKIFEGIHQNLTILSKKVVFFEHPYTNEPGGIHSPHVCIIRNLKTRKYVIISQWDHPGTLSMRHLGWDPENCLAVATSSGCFTSCDFKIEPLSQIAYDPIWELLSRQAKPWNQKQVCKLFFRGYLYHQRLAMSQIDSKMITQEKIPLQEYFNELTNNQIGLSLNGAAEICNRDFEILAARSVLFRPQLNQILEVPLIPNVHQIAVPFFADAQKQQDAFIETFDNVKNDKKKLQQIAEKGHEWYLNHGTVQANVDIACKFIIRHQELFDF